MFTIKHFHIDNSVAGQFILLPLNSERGHVMIDSMYFRFSLTKALVIDYPDRAQIKAENSTVASSFTITGSCKL